MAEEAVYLLAMEQRDPEARDEGLCPSVHRDPEARDEGLGPSVHRETQRPAMKARVPVCTISQLSIELQVYYNSYHPITSVSRSATLELSLQHIILWGTLHTRPR